MDKYDVCVIGGGPSGYAAAMRAIDFNKKVILIERDRLGGAGIYDGALSSKTFWELSKEIASINEKFKRYHSEVPDIKFSHFLEEVNDAIWERSSQLKKHLNQVNRQSNNLLFVQGSGKLLNDHEVQIQNEEKTYTIYAENIIMATGSRPRTLADIPVDGKIIMTSDGISSIREFPKSLAILGAGVIGCEFATIFSNFGKTKVHLIGKDDRILPFEDEDLARVIENNLEANGVLIHRQAEMKKMEIVGDEVEYVINTPAWGEAVFRVEKALISVGRVPNMENTGMDEIGLKLSDRGHIIDDDTQTNISNIYAVGDLTADIALVNVGELEGRHAIEKIYGNFDRQLVYENISTIMFLNPETAGVGMNEQQARQQNLSFRVASFDFSCIPRAVAMRSTQGFFKILVTDNSDMKVLGMRAIGEHASSAIQAVALLISMDKGIEELAELIHPHPSIIEGVQECVRMMFGKSIYKSSVFKDHMSFRCYRDGRYFDIDDVTMLDN